MSNVKLITISGLDGSGKSTQVEFLKTYLESQGKRFYYFHAVAFSIANCGRARKNKGEIQSVVKANWLQIQLRKIALLIDILRFRALANRLDVDFIISDRYFYDSIINIFYLTDNLDLRLPSRSFAERFIPRPDLAFYLNVEPELIMKRDRRPDQGAEYLEKKKGLFDSKIEKWQLIAIDGSKSKEEIFEIIRSKVQDQNK